MANVKFDGNALKGMIRSIVREEMSVVVKEAINEVLSDRYLKQLAEVAASRPRGVGRTMHIADGDDQEDEGTPEILKNVTQGIYQKHPSVHDDGIDESSEEDSGELTTENFSRNDMLGMFFEGTKPLNESEESHEEGIPHALIEKKIGVDVSRFGDILKATEKRAAKKAPMTRDPETEAARLKALRESLDRPAR